MKKIRQYNILKTIWIVMALHILNFSIDAPDVLNENITEDLSYNEIESFAEWIAEDILNIKNAFSESDEQGDEESGFIKKYVEITFYKVIFQDEAKPLLLNYIKNKKTQILYKESFCNTIFISIFSPPPEV
jgi:hypothetical protein